MGRGRGREGILSRLLLQHRANKAQFHDPEIMTEPKSRGGPLTDQGGTQLSPGAQCDEAEPWCHWVPALHLLLDHTHQHPCLPASPSSILSSLHFSPYHLILLLLPSPLLKKRSGRGCMGGSSVKGPPLDLGSVMISGSWN